ncbi:Thiamine-phosphate synthase [Arsenophonus endosymbiont of Aleurodicus dispersus]|uniref:thiamine phosphate synthase n=1 Tax=Arsenophonus endosymbiont of Aleurodicus dispersus TaxID=235559 RepID=UPI000EAC380A|nr:thiamine phosphate synthase [Arsenophonus endosymbiont of Aleurodicus dispersus]VAY02489.1 Thiamine-phosphate synthase [Arsenophonus endosymbiont of Aleurodicus dispersus]
MTKWPDHAFAPTEHKLGLYPVVDTVEWIRRLLDAGVTTIQLRIKNRLASNLEEDINQAIMLGKQYQARLFINDYWKLAIKHDAYGVHLGQEDIHFADLNLIQKAGLRLGISTHNQEELTKAKQLRPSYIALGHIFPTTTKLMYSSAQGLVNLKQQVNTISDYSNIAIGGISLARVPAVLATGVGGIAMVSAITKSTNWNKVVAHLLHLIEGKEIIDA